MDTIYRQDAVEVINKLQLNDLLSDETQGTLQAAKSIIQSIVPSAQPDETKYEYHYDHTDCIWYRPEARNRCPVTCSQYRDGWNDAMHYIFRDGKGYRPYCRDERYGE